MARDFWIFSRFTPASIPRWDNQRLHIRHRSPKFCYRLSPSILSPYISLIFLPLLHLVLILILTHKVIFHLPISRYSIFLYRHPHLPNFISIRLLIIFKSWTFTPICVNNDLVQMGLVVVLDNLGVPKVFKVFLLREMQVQICVDVCSPLELKVRTVEGFILGQEGLGKWLGNFVLIVVVIVVLRVLWGVLWGGDIADLMVLTVSWDYLLLLKLLRLL